MSESEGPKQVSDPAYHGENHTAVQACEWTTNVPARVGRESTR